MDLVQTGSSLNPRPLQVVKMQKSASVQDMERSPTPIFRRVSSSTDQDTVGDPGEDVTPRAIRHPVAGKSSSYSILRFQTPKLLTRLRSFSNGRQHSNRSCGPSTGTLIPHQPGQIPSLRNVSSKSGGSSSDGSYDPQPVMPQRCNDATGLASHHAGVSICYANQARDAILEPILLIPQIRIIPERTAVGDGQTAV